MGVCQRCNGTGFVTKGFWIFKKAEYCHACDGTGETIEGRKKGPGVRIDGDPRRMQKVFHVMAKARKLAEENRMKKDFQLNRELRRAQAALREKRYDDAMEHAGRALEMAEGTVKN